MGLGDSPATSSKGSMSPEERDARVKFTETELPMELPCDAPSYLVQMAESDKPSPWMAIFVKSSVAMDFVKVFFAIFSGLLTMYAVVFHTLDKQNSGWIFLSFFAAAYPIVMMGLLLTRSNDMSLRKECYYLLLKYKCLMDWNNWVWKPNGKDCVIWRDCHFAWFWAATLILQVAFGVRNNSALREDGCGGMADYSLALVVILQVLVLGYQFYATLGVEESGIITLNKFLENKEGESNPKGVEQYIDPGPLRDRPVVIRPEDFIKQWAVARYSKLPNKFQLREELCRVGTQEYKIELSEWQNIAKGDLKALRGLQEPTWTVEGLSYLQSWLWQRIWGYCLVDVLRHHPDFEAMRPALQGLFKLNLNKVALSFFIAAIFEAYACWILFWKSWEASG